MIPNRNVDKSNAGIVLLTVVFNFDKILMNSIGFVLNLCQNLRVKLMRTIRIWHRPPCASATKFRQSASSTQVFSVFLLFESIIVAKVGQTQDFMTPFKTFTPTSGFQSGLELVTREHPSCI